MNIYAGNLNYRISESDLEELFGEYGEVTTVKLIKDKFTGRAKGFGFVEMSNDDEARTAISELDGTDVMGRNIKVNEARPQKVRD
jgi:RNA recognition motif-containing protein